MNVYEALRVEGSSYYRILCYGIYSAEEVDMVYSKLSSMYSSDVDGFYKFHDDSWPSGIVLCESKLNDQEEIVPAVPVIIEKLFSVGGCKAVVCMFDGAFTSYEDLFSSSVADQVYAFCMNAGSLVMMMDDSVRGCKEWRDIVSRQKSRVN